MADNSLDRKIKDVDNTSPMGGGSFILRELSIKVNVPRKTFENKSS